jgi:hypothetical protein
MAGCHNSTCQLTATFIICYSFMMIYTPTHLILLPYFILNIPEGPRNLRVRVFISPFSFYKYFHIYQAQLVSMKDAIKQQQTNKYNATDHCYMTKQKCLYIVKNCTGSLAENRSYHWKTSYSYIQQS